MPTSTHTIIIRPRPPPTSARITPPGLRLVWIAGRAETSIDLQHAIVGDAFGMRAMVETSVRLK
jgi:hypothetical protein